MANTAASTVTPIATATNTAGTAIPVGLRPIGIAITPDGKTAYVANDGANTVTPIATATNTAGTAHPGRDAVPPAPTASHPDGDRLVGHLHHPGLHRPEP